MPLPRRIFQRLPEAAKRTARGLLRSHPLLMVLKFHYGRENMLREKGWYASEKRGLPVDKHENPIPWYTYSCIDFLDDTIDGDMRVFEYGSGYSSIWYDERAGYTVAVDDEKEWKNEIESATSDSCQIEFTSSSEEYFAKPREYDEFDVIAIDGAFDGESRTKCINPAIDSVTDEGVIVIDDFSSYDEEDWKALEDAGFKHVPFRGLKALGTAYRSTAIFYRDGNVLGL